ncbi:MULTISPECIES: GntR family transcriptional regulator [unclassified Pseudoclavibacter]|uniref:GntR family transcriptional regulator n=1 Tax=unclassified Pseudoclavibacter TaxID=2615177 RepID=UPI000CE7D6AF|nr:MULTISPECIES: GntR family transcriptional regulator [unclassified Pseudoclavibacter]PPF38483.1 GntR family transcriptional regulator [Pseudoclavibacter sp. AY1H1]PPG03343.1 GntR family transcriptional regulator [Pseudoclavibacter sp. RFBI5]
MPAPASPARPLFRSKSELAYEELRRRILTGIYAPGDVIGQTKLAAELGLSTTPLREALKRLSTEGLVDLGAHRDARVIPLSQAEAQNLYEVRAAADPLACALAAERRDDSDLTRIEAALGELEPLTGVASAEALDAHRRFHRSIYRAAANPTLLGILDGLWDKTDLYRQRALRAWTPTPEDRARVHRQHSALRDAIVAGDAERARELSHAHITHSLARRAIGALETSTAPRSGTAE